MKKCETVTAFKLHKKIYNGRDCTHTEVGYIYKQFKRLSYTYTKKII